MTVRGIGGYLIAAAAIGVTLHGAAMGQERTPGGPADALPFEIDAKATVDGAYRTNVFSTDTNVKGDYLTIIQPEIGLSKKGESYQLAVGGSVEIGRYFSLTSENYIDGAVRAQGRVEILDKIVLFGGGDFLWEHEPRTSPDDVGGREPTRYTDGSTFAGVSGELDPFTFRLGVNYRNLDFDDVAAGGGAIINNDDRDREHLEFGTRLGYIFMPKTQAFVQVVHDTRSYSSAVDDNGFRRGSTGIQVAVGVAGEIGNLSGEVLVGGLFYDYDDVRFNDLVAPDIGAKLTWRPNARTRVTGSLERDVNETTIFGSSSYVGTVAGARVDHFIAPDLSAFGYAFFSQNDYQSVARTDYVSEAGFGLRYFLTRNVFVGAQYGFESRSSDVAAADYTGHEFLLSIGADLDPTWRGDPALAMSERSGFYVGLQGMHGAVLTPITGRRGGGGTLAAEFGDFGLGGGLFAGYRLRVKSFLVGLEAEADLARTKWTHVGNRTFSIERKESFGASGILGFFTRNDVLLFGRAGIASTAFDGSYRRGGNAASLSERRTGLRFGLGAEFPIGGGLSGRMEYTYANYGDFVFGAPLGSGNDDIFNNAEALARFGLVYQFGPAPEMTPMAVDFSGFYIGAQVGHEVLATDNVGPRPTAVAPAFTLNATRAGDGFVGGLFLGFGMTFGDVYLGAEVEAEIANTNWNIERDPTGRIYSAEKLGSVGGSLRAGYILNDSVLVYLRGGLVATRFENEYAFGGAVVADAATLAGVRFGGGIEFAVSDAMRMRLDYTRSLYSDYTVSYPAGLDRFDPSEHLFRVGLILGF